MINAKSILFCTNQLKNVAAIIEGCAVAMSNAANEDDNEIAAQMMLDELEQTQKLVIMLTQRVTEVIDQNDADNSQAEVAEDSAEAPPPDSQSAFGAGELDYKKKGAVENAYSEPST